MPRPAQPPVGPAPLIGELKEALAALHAHGPVSGTVMDTLTLLRLAEQARGLALRELAELDASGAALPGIRATAASWLRDAQLLGEDTARSTVRLARQLRDTLPQLGQLLCAGGTTEEHAAAVAHGVRGLDQDILADTDADQAFTALARAAAPHDIRATLRDKATDIDPRLAADADRKARDRQGLRLTQVGAHTAVDGTLAGEHGALVRLAMSLAVEAGRTQGDKRGVAARHADVLIGWASDYLHRQHGPGDSLNSDTHLVRTHLLVACTPTDLAAAQPAAQPAAARCDHQERRSLTELIARGLAGAPPVSPSIIGDDNPLTRGALRHLACDATIDLIVRGDSQPGGPLTGQHLGLAGSAGADLTQPSSMGGFDPLYVGRSARTVTQQQFKALVLRDRTCIVRGCNKRPARCAAHHVKHWADGGLTDLDNLVLLCHQHHHDHHDRGQDLPHHDGLRWLTQTGWAPAPP